MEVRKFMEILVIEILSSFQALEACLITLSLLYIMVTNRNLHVLLL